MKYCDLFGFRELITRKQKTTIRGRVWYDLDKNNKYNKPPDVPIANTEVLLVRYNARSRSRRALPGDPVGLCKTTTDAVGKFSMECYLPKNISEFAVVKEDVPNEPLLLVTVTEQTGTDAEPIDVPVPRPDEVNFPQGVTARLVNGLLVLFSSQR